MYFERKYNASYAKVFEMLCIDIICSIAYEEHEAHDITRTHTIKQAQIQYREQKREREREKH